MKSSGKDKSMESKGVAPRRLGATIREDKDAVIEGSSAGRTESCK